MNGQYPYAHAIPMKGQKQSRGTGWVEVRSLCSLKKGKQNLPNILQIIP